jgi:uncharacterized protein (TIGR02246 family)
MTDDERAIRQLVDHWLTAIQKGDLRAVLKLMDDDVTFMVPGRRSFGKEAFAVAFRQMKGARVSVKSHIQEIAIFGDLAYMRNHLEVTMLLLGAELVHGAAEHIENAVYNIPVVPHVCSISLQPMLPRRLGSHIALSPRRYAVIVREEIGLAIAQARRPPSRLIQTVDQIIQLRVRSSFASSLSRMLSGPGPVAKHSEISLAFAAPWRIESGLIGRCPWLSMHRPWHPPVEAR